MVFNGPSCIFLYHILPLHTFLPITNLLIKMTVSLISNDPPKDNARIATVHRVQRSLCVNPSKNTSYPYRPFNTLLIKNISKNIQKIRIKNISENADNVNFLLTPITQFQRKNIYQNIQKKIKKMGFKKH